MGCPNDSAKFEQSFIVDLILSEQFRVVSEIAQKPIQLPKRSFGAVEPAQKRSFRKRFGLENDKPQRQERLLRMPAIGSSIDPNESQPFEKTVSILLP